MPETASPLAFPSGRTPRVPRVLCFGEVLWDCLPRGLFPGGAPFNVAYHLTRLGLEAVPVTAVGDDFLGRELLRRLEGWGIDTRLVNRLGQEEARETGVVRATLQADGSAKYEIVEEVAWDRIEPGGLALQMAAQSAALVYGTLAQRSAHNRARLPALLAATAGGGGLRIYDVNLRPPYDSPELVAELAAQADLIKLNDEELRLLTGERFSGEALEEAARAWADQTGCSRICVTAGARGAGLLQEGWWTWAEGRPVKVRDTIGAGDSFLAALIAGLLRPEALSPREVLERACRLGEFVAASDGATPDYAVSVRGRIGLPPLSR